MTWRPMTVIAICAAFVALVSAFPAAIERLLPATGLTRSVFTQPGFSGVPDEAHTSEINLGFLDEQTSLPRQNFSARWRGFFFVPRAQTIEFFAGGNDEVELRVDGELLLTRSLREGMRTVGRRITLEAGAHEIAVDYQQFGGGMALNIQRALEGQQPAPFSPAELFSQRVDSRQVLLLNAARSVRRITPYLWLGLFALLIGSASAANFSTWRTKAAPQNAREYGTRVWFFAAPALLVPAVVFLLGAHTIFLNNAAEFAVSFGELAAPRLLRTVAVNWIILLAAGCLIAVLSERLTRMYAAMLFAIGLLLWGQGNLWNADYGVLAGQDLDLGVHAWRAPYELAAWAGVLFLALVCFRPVSRIAPFASIVFLAVQLAAVVLSDGSAAAQRVRWIEPPPSIYEFSADRNVIHIVLDEFQSDVFNDIFQQDRASLDRQFSGFSISPSTPGRFRRHRSACRQCWLARNTGMKSRLPSSYAKRSSRTRFSRKSREAGYDIDATINCACRFVRAMDGTGSGAKLEGCEVPDSQAFRQPGRLPRSLGAAAARAFAVPPRAARGEGVQRRSAGYVLSTDLDGSTASRRHR